MLITWILLALGIMLAAGAGALLLRRQPRLATSVGSGGAILGSLVGLVPAVRTLASAGTESLHLPWSVPLGSLALGLDPLSAFFLLPVFGLTALAALYGREYLRPEFGRRNVGAHWFFYNLLAIGMALVVLARNGVLFLTAWEVMSVASFFLVTFEHEQPSVREAGWTYLVATHLGTAFLLALFLLLGQRAGSLDFGAIRAQGAPAPAGLLFLLAVIGFGTKAGFLPLHVWLPEAHPAAPSHVSALMSGVMIKTGIYGLVRTFTLLGNPPAWWGYVLLGIGLSSGVLGVLFALAQHDLKRLLAYHSVENIGIIALGLGIGLLGVSAHSPALAILGFGGGLLHVLNHALFKGLLFLGAGTVLHATGSGEIDRQGGLLKRLPWTGAFFLLGSAAICGLPPLNGFVSEFLIYLAALTGGNAYGAALAGPLLISAAGLALIGGLAAACFTKVCGVIFLGEPRSPEAAQAHEAGPSMRWAMGVLAALCLLAGLGGPAVFYGVAPAVAEAAGLPSSVARGEILAAGRALLPLTLAAAGLLAFLLLAALFRHRRLARHQRLQAVTWDCGYAQPTPRMQYTASSFAQPLLDTFRIFLHPRSRVSPPAGLFPSRAALQTETPDLFRRRIFEPLFRGTGRVLAQWRWLQHGRVQLYVLYIAAALLALLVWKMR